MQKLIRNAFFLTVYTVLAIPLGYLVRLQFSQYLTIEEFGLFYAIIGFFGLIGIFNDLGFSDTQIFFLPKYLQNKEYHKIKAAIKVQLLNQLVTTLLISAVIFFGANYLSHNFFHYDNATPIILLMIIYFIASDFFKNTQTLFTAFQERTIIGSSEFIRLSLTTITLFLAFNIFRVEGLMIVAWIWTIIYIFIAVIYSVIFVKQHPEIFKAGYYPIREIYKEFIPFSISILLINSASVIFPATSSFLLTYFRGVREVALYNIAEPISNILLTFVTPLSSLLFPLSSQLDELKDQASILKLINSILNLGVFILLPLIATLVFYASESITFLFGSKFLAASTALQIFAFYVLFTVLNKFIFNIITGLGMQSKRTRLIYIAAIINTLLAFFLIPVYGVVGAVISITISQLVLFTGGVWILNNKIHFSLPLINYCKMLVLLIGYILIELLFKQISSVYTESQFVLFILKATTGICLYYAIGIFIFKITDLRVILNIITRNFPLFDKYVKLLGKMM